MDPNSIERYDRQIRLWGQHGQSKCSNSRICLINADSLGLEILKGLCLAGIGSFAILDSHKFTSEDIGSCFIDQSRVGKSRAEAAKAMLLDINEEAICDVYPMESQLPHIPVHDQRTTSNADYVNPEVKFWKQFNCIIASGNLYMTQIGVLSEICWTHNIPLIQCKSIGFYGYLRNQLGEHHVIDTHPEWRPANADTSKPDSAVISTKPINEEYEDRFCYINSEDDDDSFITEYICLKALDLFYSTYGRSPGHNSDQVETDTSKLKECVKRMVGRSYSQLETRDQCLYELCRYGGAELHVTSAFIGGCVAQEAIKMITNQYVPVNDALVYNAMTAATKTFKSSDIFSRPH